MKKYQIFKQVNGQSAKAVSDVADTKEVKQANLRSRCCQHFASLDDYCYFNLDIIEQDKQESIIYVGYDEPGYYKSQGINANGYGIIELIISDSEILSFDFDRYGYDNWFEFIQEVDSEE